MVENAEATTPAGRRVLSSSFIMSACFTCLYSSSKLLCIYGLIKSQRLSAVLVLVDVLRDAACTHVSLYFQSKSRPRGSAVVLWRPSVCEVR